MPVSPRSRHLTVEAALACFPFCADAQTAGTSCADLLRRCGEATRAANGFVPPAVEHALKGSDRPGQLQWLDLGGSSPSPNHAVRRGALAALLPPVQAAILMFLLRASGAMQALAWKGCHPSGSSK